MSSEQNKIGSRAEKYGRANSKAEASPRPTTSNKNKKAKPKKSLLLYSAIALVLFIIGSMIGYGFLGGRNALEVFNIDTWLHMYNLIFG